MIPHEGHARLESLIRSEFPELSPSEVLEVAEEARNLGLGDWQDADLILRLVRSLRSETLAIQHASQATDEDIGIVPLPDWLKEGLGQPNRERPKIVSFPHWFPGIAAAAAVLVVAGLIMFPFRETGDVRGGPDGPGNATFTLLSPGTVTALQQPVISWTTLLRVPLRVTILEPDSGAVVWRTSLAADAAPVVICGREQAPPVRLRPGQRYIVEITGDKDDSSIVFARREFRVTPDAAAETPVALDLDDIEATVRRWLAAGYAADAVGWLKTAPEPLGATSRLRRLRIETMDALQNEASP